MGYTKIENYATRVEKHCDRAKASTFLCEDSSAKGDFATAEKHAKEAISELELAIEELTRILPEEPIKEPEIREYEDGRDFDEPYATETEDRIYGI